MAHLPRKMAPGAIQRASSAKKWTPATFNRPTCHTTVTHLPRLGVPPATHCSLSPLKHNIAIPGALAVEGEGVGWSELAEMGMRDGLVQGVVPR